MKIALEGPMIYRVQAGDYLSKIAAAHGFADWHAVYDHPDNAAFRARRPNPNVLYAGDELFIPERDTRQFKVRTRQTAKFVLHRRSNKLRLKLLDKNGEPLAKKACTLEHGTVRAKVSTDGDGMLEADVPCDLAEATLTVGDDVLKLQLGQLNPLDQAPDGGVSGVQARLANLGYYRGPIDGTANDELSAAVRAFRADQQLPDSSAFDDAQFSAALTSAHGN